MMRFDTMPSMRNSRSIFILFILSIIITLPLFSGKVIQGHDTQYAFIKTVSMFQSWKDGDFVGRWTPDIIHGYGYPAFNFYAPLFFAISAALSFVVHNLIWGFNLALFLTFFGAACAMYFYAKEFWGIEGGLLSAIAYLIAPYHLVELYVRGACGELTAFVCIPFALYAFQRLSINPKSIYFLIACVSLAGLALSHNLTALFCFPLLFAYCLLIIIQKKFNLKWVTLYFGVFALALGLSAYFWAPALLEEKYVQISRILQCYDYRQHFLFWDQLFYCPWGNGGSGPTRADDTMSFQIGPVHLILILVLLFNFKRINLERFASRAFIIFWFIVSLLAALVTLKISAFFWKMIPVLQLASMPWRFLLIATLGVSFLTGGICTIFKNKRIAFLGGAALIIAANIFYCHSFGYQDITIPTPKAFLQSSTPLDVMEYLPKKVKLLRLIPSENKLEVLQGQGEILNYKSNSGLHHTYDFMAATEVALAFHSFDFPGWKVIVDKQSTQLIENPFGLIVFAVAPGEHSIEITFTNTPLHSLLQYFSLIVLGILAFIFLFRQKIDARFKTIYME